MADTEGRPRILIRVAPDGSPTIRLLNQAGKLLAQLPEAQSNPR